MDALRRQRLRQLGLHSLGHEAGLHASRSLSGAQAPWSPRPSGTLGSLAPQALWNPRPSSAFLDILANCQRAEAIRSTP